MIIKMFSVYDEKAQAYMAPFQFIHTAQAERTFSDCINSPDHQFSHHPSDYTLFEIGSFDDSNAAIQAPGIKSLGNGVEFLKPDDQSYLPGLEPDEKTIEPGALQPST